LNAAWKAGIYRPMDYGLIIHINPPPLPYIIKSSLYFIYLVQILSLALCFQIPGDINMAISGNVTPPLLPIHNVVDLPN
jgi:hypothetical protein